jgi:hypothetical protein
LGNWENPENANIICQLKGMGRVHYPIRNTTAAVPAFVITPKGVSAREYLSSSRQAKVEMLLLLWSNILAALDFAHEKGVFHLDVSPRNIIYHNGCFTLIGWGCAACDGESVRVSVVRFLLRTQMFTQRRTLRHGVPKRSMMRPPCCLLSVHWMQRIWSLGRISMGGLDEGRRALTKKTLTALINEYKETIIGQADETHLYGLKVSGNRGKKLDAHIASIVKDA